MNAPTTDIEMAHAAWQVVRRNKAVVPFDPQKIAVAMTKAFVAVEGGASSRIRDLVAHLTGQVVEAIRRRQPGGGTCLIEDIQDQVELALMRSGEHDVARAYVLYREKRAAERAAAGAQVASEDSIEVVDGAQRSRLDRDALLARCMAASQGLDDVSATSVLADAWQSLYDGVSMQAVRQALVLAARTRIERSPDYSKLAARLLLDALRHEVMGEPASQADMGNHYPACLQQCVERGIAAELLDPRLAQFDLARLGAELDAQADLRFDYLGLQTLYDRYFLHVHGQRIELPQVFFMRVAMGLAINEIDREARAIEFYRLLSSFDFMCSTPTLFNAGTRHPQLSSCYLTTVADDLDGIFQAVKENALLQKFAGGLGNDWTPVRALGSRIRGTNGQSQGVIPFLKVVNDTAVAVNQGGKRKGAVCAYLETWHLDIEDFLELRKNTGDERRRAHDMNTAHWIPDLFIKRVMDEAEWTLFSPDEVPELHDQVGAAFEAAYEACEARADAGQIHRFKRLPAVQLWRRMLTMLFETGHPWLTFKDACNLRSPQQHVGVVHSSNLCTEITLNTGPDETAVCNLGSVNLPAHLVDTGTGWQLDLDKLQRTVRTAMRMLDNVIDINFYPITKARNANLRHRPVGLGMMGFSDALHRLGIGYASDAAVTFADRSAEALCHAAYWASTELAEARGRYSSFTGSLWDRGMLPQDSIDLLIEARGRCHRHDGPLLTVERAGVLDWTALRERIARFGMRNSNCVAIAPTATIANIVGVSASIEPDYQNLYVKSNLSGEFTMVNADLVHELQALDLWDEVMIADLKYFDGALAQIDRVPDEIKARYATAFEIEPRWLIECAARRQKWIDQAQSLNLYLAKPSGRQLDEMYRLAWLRGLKTTYYLRARGATGMEQSSAPTDTTAAPAPKVCAILDPDCEACQ